MQNRKGIILAGGAGTRLWPITVPMSKQLLPVYDKPMIYYPLTTLMLAGIRDILVITTPEDSPLFRKLLADGSEWGVNISYEIQPKPEGIAQAFIIAADFLDGAPSALVLGDNIYFGAGFPSLLAKMSARQSGATGLAYYVKNPEPFGVCLFGEDGAPVALKEKPKEYLSNWAVTGLYFYDENVVEIARSIQPSERGELEITAVNQAYLDRGQLHVEKIGRGYAWLDAGTHSALLEASQFVHSIEQRQGLKIGCPEEVSWRMGFISTAQLRDFIKKCTQKDYADYLSMVLNLSN